MNILVFYPYIPYPIDRGTYQRTFHLLRELSREHTIDLLALDEGGERGEHRPIFEQFCKRVEIVPFEHPQWAKFFPDRLLSSTPTSIQHWTLPHVATALDTMLSTGQYDCAYVCDIVLAQYFLDRHSDLPIYLDRSRVDLQFQTEQRRHMAKGWRARALQAECIAKMKKYENRIAHRVSAEIVCGPDDEIFIRENISPDVPVKVITNGADLGYFHPEASDAHRDTAPTVLFCGAMDYTPNIDALRWFFADIHAPLLALVPDLRVLIVGKAPLPEVEAYATRQGVSVTGGVPDVRPYYRRAWMQIVPLRIGGGTRLKIVESMAIGTPVISTSIGAQGLGLIHDHDILLADTASDFAQQTARALGDVTLRATLDVNGQKTAQSRLAWPRLGRELSDYLTQHHTGSQLRSGPPVSILGIPLDNVTMKQTIAQIDAMIASHRPHCIATANVDFVVQASHDLELRRILHDAHLVLCDGTPLIWASRMLGNPIVERVAGSDLVPRLLAHAEQCGYRVFFLGAEPAVAAEAIRRIRLTHPNLEIAGTLSPPFRPLLEMDHVAIVKTIRAARPDILLVSFGCPKQEKWISMNYRNLGVPVSIGVGATIDFIAGHMKRAPHWMHNIGLEWLYRLAQEPRRLAKRYWTDFVVFAAAFAHQEHTIRPHPPAPQPAITLREEALATIITLPPRIDAACATHPIFDITCTATLLRPVVIDGAFVESLDSTGLALLSRLHRRLREATLAMVLARPSAALSRVLRSQGLDALIEVREDIDSALHHVTQLALERPVSHIDLDLDNTSTLAWQGEVTAANAREVWQITEVLLGASHLRGSGDIEINLSRVRFMDSTGVGLMVKARKRGRASGVSVRFIDPSPATRNVVQMLRLEKHLFDDPQPHASPFTRVPFNEPQHTRGSTDAQLLITLNS